MTRDSPSTPNPRNSPPRQPTPPKTAPHRSALSRPRRKHKAAGKTFLVEKTVHILPNMNWNAHEVNRLREHIHTSTKGGKGDALSQLVAPEILYDFNMVRNSRDSDSHEAIILPTVFHQPLTYRPPNQQDDTKLLHTRPTMTMTARQPATTTAADLDPDGYPTSSSSSSLGITSSEASITTE